MKECGRNLNKDISVDDEVVDDNKDRDKILRTIRAIIYEFTSFYPPVFIFFSGSTPARTRLFRMILSIDIASWKKDFHIYGVLENENNLIRVPFTKYENYYAFMIKKKH